MVRGHVSREGPHKPLSFVDGFHNTTAQLHVHHKHDLAQVRVANACPSFPVRLDLRLRAVQVDAPLFREGTAGIGAFSGGSYSDIVKSFGLSHPAIHRMAKHFPVNIFGRKSFLICWTISAIVDMNPHLHG